MRARIPIVHVINSFQFGGAEAMLCNILLRTDRSRFEPSVVSLIDDMSVAGPIIDAGIPIHVIGMRPGIPDPRGIWKLAWHLRRIKPAVVQTWMDHSNLIGGIAARLATRAAVVWGVHHSNHVKGVSKKSTLMTVGACARLSRWLPTRTVLCSHSSHALYSELGFAPEKMSVIPNGFDTQKFCPDPEARLSVRKELGVASDTPLIGLAARFDPMKDPLNFLQAAALLANRFPEAHFVVYGAGMDTNNTELVHKAADLQLTGRISLIGPRRDVARVHASLDIAVLSSISEAFPLVLGEAMACEVPCVSTDVGDAGRIVGPFGRIVPPKDPSAMANACAELLEMNPAARAQLGKEGRKRVCELFDLGSVTRQYELLYQQVMDPALAREDDEEIFAEPVM